MRVLGRDFVRRCMGEMGDSENMEQCRGCGALVPRGEGPAHAYIGASPGCWTIYGEVLEREYADYERYFEIHRLTVDAYAAQHPGEPCRRFIQSVAVHLIRLHLMLERGLCPERANAKMQSISAREDFFWLEPPCSLGEITVVNVRCAAGPKEHVERVRRWAESVWGAWSVHHDTVRRWAEAES